MDLITKLFDFILNIDAYIIDIVNSFGIFSYVIFGLMIFAETGLVVVPFLPGDSVLFVIGLLASQGALNLWVIIIVLAGAAILGDACNYVIGHFLGEWLLRKEKIKRLLGKQVEKTKAFYQKHGGITIIYARFIPGIRLIAPFLAGVTNMSYPKFAIFNITGGVSWVILITLTGYFLGNVTFIKGHLTVILLCIVFISLLPVIIAYIRSRKKHVIVHD